MTATLRPQPPNLRYVSTPVQRSRRPERAPLLTARQVRDLLGIVLVIVGIVGTLVVAFLAHPLAGFGLLAVDATVLGAYLCYDR